MTTLRRAVARLSLVALGLLAGLAGAEGLVRLVAPQPFVTGDLRWEQHPAVGYRLQPDCDIRGELGGHINALGLRGPDVGPRREGEWRVLAVGDSFTYGAGVPAAAAFPIVLQERLATGGHLPQGRVPHCINAGTVAYGTRRQLAWLRAFADPLEADEVLLGFFVGNDFSDNYGESAPRIVDGQLVRGDLEESEWSLRMRIWRNESHLYRWWRKRSYNGPVSGPPDPNADQTRAVEQGLGDRIALYAEKDAAPERLRERIEGAYDATRVALDELLAWCRERGLPLKVALIPDILQVEGQPEREVVERFPALRGRVDPLRPQKEVLTWCAENGVPCLDLLPPMQAHTAETGESLHLGFDPHWNEAGHRFAADLMAVRLWPRE